jgi:hypothetical protein
MQFSAGKASGSVIGVVIVGVALAATACVVGTAIVAGGESALVSMTGAVGIVVSGVATATPEVVVVTLGAGSTAATTCRSGATAVCHPNAPIADTNNTATVFVSTARTRFGDPVINYLSATDRAT